MEYCDKTKVFRTSCQCAGEDPLTFHVSTDAEYPEVYLEMWCKCYSNYTVWQDPWYTRPFRTFWRRLKAATKLMFSGYVEIEGAFIFRGEEHIDEFCETVQAHKEKMKERVEEINNEREQESVSGD